MTPKWPSTKKNQKNSFSSARGRQKAVFGVKIGQIRAKPVRSSERSVRLADMKRSVNRTVQKILRLTERLTSVSRTDRSVSRMEFFVEISKMANHMKSVRITVQIVRFTDMVRSVSRTVEKNLRLTERFTPVSRTERSVIRTGLECILHSKSKKSPTEPKRLCFRLKSHCGLENYRLGLKHNLFGSVGDFLDFE